MPIRSPSNLLQNESSPRGQRDFPLGRLTHSGYVSGDAIKVLTKMPGTRAANIQFRPSQSVETMRGDWSSSIDTQANRSSRTIAALKAAKYWLISRSRRAQRERSPLRRGALPQAQIK